MFFENLPHVRYTNSFKYEEISLKYNQFRILAKSNMFNVEDFY